MIVYLTINIIIISLALVFCGIIKRSDTKDNHNLPSYLFLGASFLILFFISAFRGDFTSDYNNYKDLFDYFRTLSFTQIFTTDIYQETGFVILNWIIGVFSGNVVYLMLVTSFMILVLFFREFKNYSECLWLSILLFINIGAYYISFNILRQILAVAIVFSASKYLYRRKFIKYLLIIIMASLFHKTALIMIPFYFILNLKYSKKNISIVITSSFLVVLFLDKIMEVIKRYWYAGYTYGMTGLNFKSAVVPITVLIFVLFYSRLLDAENSKHNVWINATSFYTVFSIFGLKVQMLQRFAEFFSPYVMLIIPFIIVKNADKKLKIVYFYIITILMVAYNYVILRGTGYDPFYFFWQK